MYKSLNTIGGIFFNKDTKYSNKNTVDIHYAKQYNLCQ